MILPRKPKSFVDMIRLCDDTIRLCDDTIRLCDDMIRLCDDYYVKVGEERTYKITCSC